MEGVADNCLASFSDWVDSDKDGQSCDSLDERDDDLSL